MKRNQILILTIGALIVLLTSLIYFLKIVTPDTNLQHNLLFGFIVLSEVLTTLSLVYITSKKDNLFTTSGTASITAIYFIATIICNVVLGFIKDIQTNTVILANSIIVILSIIVFLIIIIFTKKGESNNEQK